MKKHFLESVIALSLFTAVFPSNAAMLINPSTGWSGHTWVNRATPQNIWLTDSTTGEAYETRETSWGIYVNTDSVMSFRVEVPQGDYISIMDNSLTIDGEPGSLPARYIYHVNGFIDVPGDYTGDTYIGSYLSGSNEDGFYFERNSTLWGNEEQFERFTNSIKDRSYYQYYVTMGSTPGGFEYDINLPAGYHLLTFAAWAIDGYSSSAGVLASAEFSSAAPIALPATVWLFVSGLLGLYGMRKVVGYQDNR